MRTSLHFHAQRREKEITGMRVSQVAFSTLCCSDYSAIADGRAAVDDAVLLQCTFMLTSQSNFVACDSREIASQPLNLCSPGTMCVSVYGGISGRIGRLMDERIVLCLDFGRWTDIQTTLTFMWEDLPQP